MKRRLRALIAEDSPDDAELLLLELRSGGYEVEWKRVETEEEMTSALAQSEWDIVFSDFAMPRFSAPAALETLKRTGRDIPFVIVSGTIGEATAVDAMRAGAQDFLLKGRLARLSPVVARELHEAEQRRERRRMKEQLRASEIQYRKIVETAQEGIWLLDGEGRTTYANQRLSALLDRSPEELTGLPFGGFVDEESREARARLLAALARGEEVREELSFIRRDGERFWASVAASPILDDDGRTSRLLAMVTDLSEQRRLLAQVMASDRLASVGVLAAGVAHDLKNALAGVLANLELAGRDAKSVDGAREASATLSRLQAEIADAREGVERVHEIARDLNLLAGPAEDRTSLVDLRRPLESASRICGARIRERARLEKRFVDIPLVRADESKLVQVFLNLLVNASQALPMSPGPNARIEISTRVDESGEVVAEVLDSGSGMTRETLERLFTPFFTTKPHGEGTGLGLSICRRIVESFGGTIVVESELHRGSRFSIRFPPAADQVAPAVEAPPASVATMRRATILLVDDDETVRSVIARILEQHHQLTACGSAEAALEALGGLPHVDLILSDVQMPGLSGLQFYEELRRRSPDLAERVVFLTGGAVGSRAEEFLATVPNTRLEKPFRVSELLEHIARALARFESSESVG